MVQLSCQVIILSLFNRTFSSCSVEFIYSVSWISLFVSNLGNVVFAAFPIQKYRYAFLWSSDLHAYVVHFNHGFLNSVCDDAFLSFFLSTSSSTFRPHRLFVTTACVFDPPGLHNFYKNLSFPIRFICFFFNVITVLHSSPMYG